MFRLIRLEQVVYTTKPYKCLSLNKNSKKY